MPIDVRNLEQYALFKYFYEPKVDENGEQIEEPDLSNGGLNEVNPAGAQKMYDYALKHEFDGSVSSAEDQMVDGDEKEFIRALLGHPEYSSYFEQDGKLKLLELFGLAQDEVEPLDLSRKPRDIGVVDFPKRVSMIDSNQLANIDKQYLPQLFAREYKMRQAEMERGPETAHQKGVKVLGLLRDYADALWAHGERPNTEQIGHDLLDAFEETRYGPKVGAKNYNGAPFGSAQGLVLGIDANSFPHDFPEAGSDVSVTYLSMNQNMAEPMGFVDEYRKALGLPEGAKEHELRSPINFLIGEPTGHNKAGSLNESSPFSSSGVNWGIVMFPGDEQIRELEPKSGFEFPIDCVDALSNFIRCNPSHGDTFEVHDKDGNAVNVEKIIHNDDDGKPESWSAKFTNGEGEEIQPGDVIGRIKDASGRLKGDGKTGGSVNMWWWGFCDRNTAQKLYKAKYGIPDLNIDVVKVRAGEQTIEVPKDLAQKLVDADVPDLVTGETMAGFRFNDEPQQVQLKNGKIIQGRVDEDLFGRGYATSKLNSERIQGDVISVHNGAERPLLGSIKVKTERGEEELDVRNISKIEKAADSDELTIHMDGGFQSEVKGTAISDLPWDQAETVDGKQVIKQGDNHPIRGEIEIRTARGPERVDAGDINQIVGEVQNDQRFSQFMTWVSKNEGMYATDASTGPVVSNGMRWTNAIELDERTGDDRPDWAGSSELNGMSGPLERVSGDRIVFARARHSNKPGEELRGTSFAGFMQVSKSGRILNEGFTSGEPDFGWSAIGPLNWNKASSFNPNVVPEMRIGLMVNGHADLKTDTENTDALAKKLNLPANFRDYRTPVDAPAEPVPPADPTDDVA